MFHVYILRFIRHPRNTIHPPIPVSDWFNSLRPNQIRNAGERAWGGGGGEVHMCINSLQRAKGWIHRYPLREM